VSGEAGQHEPAALAVSERTAARMLEISERKLWQMRHDGEIPFVRLGCSIRYVVDDLRTWLERQRQKAT
jgi:excisionase family DNA binding protein